MSKKQVLVIHGGDTFETYEDYVNYLKNYNFTEEKFQKMKTKRWKDNLQNDLGIEFDVLKPKMPNDRNAKYVEWKIWLDKILPYLRDEVILIGHSLGGVFLAKYLSENKFPIKISQLHIVAAPFNDEKEYLGSFKLLDKLSNIQNQVNDIYLYYSQDDPYDLFLDLEKYTEALPSAKPEIFENRGHF
jgi:predicted alpha/beta hydrolase family esterase